MKFATALILALVASTARSAMWTASTPSWVDVSNAVALASTGDMVSVPAGTATWTNELLLTKAIHIIGAGTNSTVISNAIPRTGTYSDGWRPFLINVKIPTNGDVRISGFRFLCGTNQGIIWNQNEVAGDPPLYSHRIDNCIFDRAYSYAVWYYGIVDGVIDHCQFLDVRLGVGRNGSDSVDWDRFTLPLVGLGTTNTLVIESCQYVWTTNAPSSQPVDCGRGGHYVFRYNTLDYSNASTLESHDGLDLHGNNHLESVDGWRGSVFLEFYKNIFNWAGRGFRAVKLRGATSMVYSNEFNNGNSSSDDIQLDEEEMWADYVYSYPLNNAVRTNPPAQDQVTNTFIWGNFVNGNISNNLAVLYGANPNLNPVTSNTTVNPVSLAVVENVDYWQKSPWSTSYTNRGGGVNVMTNYTALIFPHPRVTADDGGSNAPSSFRTLLLNAGSVRAP